MNPIFNLDRDWRREFFHNEKPTPTPVEKNRTIIRSVRICYMHDFYQDFLLVLHITKWKNRFRRKCEQEQELTSSSTADKK